MNSWKSLVSVALALGVLLTGAGPAPGSLCGFDEIAIFAFNSVFIQKDSTVTGDLVANSESAGPTLNGGHDEVALKKNITINGDVKGHTIDVDRDTTIQGNVTYVELRLKKGARITGTQTVAPPPYTDVPEFLTASPGTVDVTAGPLETVVLGDEGFCSVTTATECASAAQCPAGETCQRAPVTSYNDIQLAGGTVIFSGGGTFNARSISGTGAVRFDAPTALRLAGRVNLGVGSSVGPSAASGIGASDIVLFVGGANGGAGGPLDPPFAFSVGPAGTVEANVYAPNGTIEMGEYSNVTGALLGRDVKIEKSALVVADGALANQAPTADPQSLEVGTAAAVTIELTGRDPEGDSLSFSIEAPGTGGSASLTEIQDPGRCSETVQSCTQDSECPGVETCVLPPVTRATVEYSAAGCGPDGCSADAFTFGVTDSCGVLATAVVNVNPDDPSGPPPPLNAVVADDIEVDVEVDSVTGITLSAGTPPSVTSLSFAVHTVPSTGTIEDELGTAITPGSLPYDLPSAVVVYAAPGSAGTASFTFSARDSAASLPCLSPDCDTGTVNIGFAERAPLAQPLSVETGLNQPVQITLQGNPGGAGTGGPFAQQSVGGPGYTWFYEAPAIGSGGGNGAHRKPADADRLPGAGSRFTGPQTRATAGLAFDAGWTATTAVPPAFFWSGGDGTFADDNFIFSGAGCLSVTDDFDKGDRFQIYDNGTPLFSTSAVPVVTGPEVGPDGAYLDATYSSGSFLIGPGAHDITIEAIVSPYGGGRGYIRVDSGSCQPNLEVTSFSAPDSAALDEPIGGQILATVTNTGIAAIPAGTTASIGYYISPDAVITTADRLLQGGRENLSQQAPGGLAIGESVQVNLFSGAAIGSQFPDGEPLTGNVFIGVLVDEFDDVAESVEGDNTAAEPISVAASAASSLVYTIATLPPAARGTLTTLSGAAVAQGQTFTGAAPTVVFQPAAGISGLTQFTYSVSQGAVSATAFVDIFVAITDTCVFNGRPVGCTTPGGVGAAAQSQGGQQAAEREVAAGPSRGLTLVVEGSGSVASSSVPLSGDRVMRGLICHSGSCNKQLPRGAEISLFARPEGDDSEFVGWSGDCWGTDPITTLRLAEHSSCTAVFGVKTGE